MCFINWTECQSVTLQHRFTYLSVTGATIYRCQQCVGNVPCSVSATWQAVKFAASIWTHLDPPPNFSISRLVLKIIIFFGLFAIAERQNLEQRELRNMVSRPIPYICSLQTQILKGSIRADLNPEIMVPTIELQGLFPYTIRYAKFKRLKIWCLDLNTNWWKTIL